MYFWCQRPHCVCVCATPFEVQGGACSLRKLHVYGRPGVVRANLNAFRPQGMQETLEMQFTRSLPRLTLWRRESASEFIIRIRTKPDFNKTSFFFCEKKSLSKSATGEERGLCTMALRVFA